MIKFLSVLATGILFIIILSLMAYDKVFAEGPGWTMTKTYAGSTGTTLNGTLAKGTQWSFSFGSAPSATPPKESAAPKKVEETPKKTVLTPAQQKLLDRLLKLKAKENAKNAKVKK